MSNRGQTHCPRESPFLSVDYRVCRACCLCCSCPQNTGEVSPLWQRSLGTAPTAWCCHNTRPWPHGCGEPQLPHRDSSAPGHSLVAPRQLPLAKVAHGKATVAAQEPGCTWCLAAGCPFREPARAVNAYLMQLQIPAETGALLKR